MKVALIFLAGFAAGFFIACDRCGAMDAKEAVEEAERHLARRKK